jgi:hypothetical protein
VTRTNEGLTFTFEAERVGHESPVAGNGGDLSSIHGSGTTERPARVGNARSHRPVGLHSKALTVKA